MHVGGLQLFQPPDGADSHDMMALFERVDRASPTSRRCSRSGPAGRVDLARAVGLGGRQAVRHRAPRAQERAAAPGPRARTADAVLAAALDAARPAPPAVGDAPDRGPRRRPVRGLLKTHHALVDGVSALRLLSPDADRGPGRPRRAAVRGRRASAGQAAEERTGSVPTTALREALSIAGDVAGLAPAFARTVSRGLNEQGGNISFSAPKTMFNVPVTGARRFAAQSWPIDADPAGRQGRRRDGQRRRAHDVLGCAAHVPAGPERAARCAADRDGAGVAARRRVRRRRWRQRGRRGHVQPRHPPRRSGRAARHRAPVDARRQGRRWRACRSCRCWR